MPVKDPSPGPPVGHAHEPGGGDAQAASCPHCAVQPGRSGSAKMAWAVAAVAVLLLVAVYFFGVGTSGGNLAASGGLVLLAVLACPLIMGAMMFMMMGEGH